MGRFKNKKVVVKTIGTDDWGMPTINGKKAATFRIPRGEEKSNSQSVYNNPDFRKILNSLQTSKYIPCGYDKDGKITKALRVIS
jgi:hypothetical protein